MASVDAMPFDLLKKKLMERLQTMGVRVVKTYEEVLALLNGCMIQVDVILFFL